MSQAPQSSLENQLLASLPSEEYHKLVANMEPVLLEFKQVLYEPNKPIEYVYFLNSGVASLLTLMQDGAVVEVATVGNEGMVGLPVFLGGDTTPGKAIAQIPGDGRRMRADVFKDLVAPCTLLHDLLQIYTQALFNLVAQSAACNRLHSLEERFCRWLLMTADRVGANSFVLTQEFLSQMLGVRRPTVSAVASTFQQADIITYSRGKMTILDREALEEASCECYEVIKAEFKRLVGGD